MIHPFRDGNGRTARILQTFILGCDGILEPGFSSIEEWLGRNAGDYYAILAKTGQGRWNPGNDAHDWMRGTGPGTLRQYIAAWSGMWATVRRRRNTQYVQP